MHTITMFLKFGSEENINDLYRNGTIYMNAIQRFREIEDGELRGDKYEGVSSIKNYPAGHFEIPSIGFKGQYIALYLRESYKQVLGNVYSLYCISSHGWKMPEDFKIEPKIRQFGSHCLMIKDNPTFLARVESKLNELGFSFTHGFVNYYNKDKVNRTISLFEKPSEFEYQKEFRIYVDRKSVLPLIFTIGSLEAIAEIHPTDTIISGLKLESKSSSIQN